VGTMNTSDGQDSRLSVGGEPPTGPWRSIWRPGDEPGWRQLADLGDLKLELGEVLPDLRVAYETYGTLNATRSNAILVEHAFTGDSHASGPAMPGHPEAGWWAGIIGPGLVIDTDRFFVVVPNVLGGCQGTTSPGQIAPDGRPWGSRWPVTTVRDMVGAEVLLADALGIESWFAVVGMSMGGMRALEWAVGQPDRVQRALIIGVGPQATAEQIALQTIQIASITEDPRYHGGDYYGAAPFLEKGPVRGMGHARRLGHVTYRSEMELHQRFGNSSQGVENALSTNRSGRYAVMSYLDHAAVRLERRFDPNTYVALNEAMNHHDIGRDRGGWRDAMKRIRARMTIIGMEEDRLYPLRLQKALAAEAPRVDGNPVALHIVRSIVGHDAFLTEDEKMAEVLGPALAE
jgi:homoserine O-acetyltransferase/O-succinyltransferase